MKWAFGVFGLSIGFVVGSASIPFFRALARNDVLRGTINTDRFDTMFGYISEVTDKKYCRTYWVYEAMESGVPLVLFSETNKKCKEERW